MDRAANCTYPPLNTLKPVADNLWIVDGPVIRFGPRWLSMPFSTRMTVMRVSGGLLVHSPTPLTSYLKAEIDAAGPVRWIVGPNRIHYWWIPDWHIAYPDAVIYLAPRIKEQAGSRVDFDFLPLDSDRGYPWDSDVATLPVRGSYLTEVEFFHRASRTLVLTDLIENFEPRKLPLLMKWLTWLGSVQYPDGQTPRDMRLTFDKIELRAAVETMIDWQPERVIVAHGRWFETNGADELRRAFRWLLK
jgi:hypothetical protein